MAVMDSILTEELERLKSLRLRYIEQIANIPAGTITIKTKRERKFAYRAYRKNGQVKTDYIGVAESVKTKEAISASEQRKNASAELKAINADIKRLEQMLNA